MKIIKEIEKELKKHIELEYREGCKKYFKEEIKLIGVRTPKTREIAKKYFQQIKNLEKKEIYSICEELLKTDISEYRTIAFDWAKRLKPKYEEKDYEIFVKWLKKYVNNWGACDDLCTHALGMTIIKYPQFLENNKKWAKSKNRWERRAAAVTLILALKKNKFLNKAFELAKILLKDKEDLVQKGYGWMLKEAANKNQKEVYYFVMKNKKEMPRTSLRYAIEKMPQELKRKAMEK